MKLLQAVTKYLPKVVEKKENTKNEPRIFECDPNVFSVFESG